MNNKVCMFCSRDYPPDYFIERPKGKPRMCKGCAALARERKRKSS